MADRDLHSILAPDELEALTAEPSSDSERGLGLFFRLRLGFGVAYVVATFIAFLVYPDRVLGKFDVPPLLMEEILGFFVPTRLMTVSALLIAYCFSLYKNIHFTSVSLAAIGIGTMNLINDYTVLFAFARPEAEAAVAVIVGLRIAVIVCIALNLRTYRRIHGT